MKSQFGFNRKDERQRRCENVWIKKQDEHLLIFGMKDGEKIEIPISGIKKMTREKALFKLFVYKHGHLFLKKGNLQIPYENIDYVTLETQDSNRLFQELLKRKVPEAEKKDGNISCKPVMESLKQDSDDTGDILLYPSEPIDIVESDQKQLNEIKNGNDIRLLREEYDMIQKAVAEAIGISARRLSDIERGKKELDEETKLAMGEYFQTLSKESINDPIELYQQEEKLEVEEKEGVTTNEERREEEQLEIVNTEDTFEEVESENQIEEKTPKSSVRKPKKEKNNLVKPKQFFQKKKEKKVNKEGLPKASSQKKVKAMRIGVWSTLILLTCSGMLAFLQSTKANVESVSTRTKMRMIAEKWDQQELPKDYSKQTDVFMQEFLKTYLNFDGTNQVQLSRRTETLKEFLPTTEIDTVSSRIIRQVNDLHLYDIKEGNGYQIAEYVVSYSILEKEDMTDSIQKVDQQTKIVDEKEKDIQVEEAGEEREKTASNLLEKKSIMEDVEDTTAIEEKEEEFSTYEQMISVPFQMDPQTGVIAICDLPYFSALPENKGTVEFQNASYNGKTDVSQSEREEITAFLKQFFETYTEKSVKDMQYLMEEPESLNGEFEFVSSESEIFKIDQMFIVKAKPIFQMSDQPIEHKENMTLKIVKKDGKFFVEKLEHGMGEIN